VKYNQKIFSWADQIRLRDCIKSASRRGVKCLITNANHASIQELYRDLGEFIAVSRNSLIAGSSDYRGTYEELAITIGYAVDASGEQLAFRCAPPGR
jgi:DNA adenine methylase